MMVTILPFPSNKEIFFVDEGGKDPEALHFRRQFRTLLVQWAQVHHYPFLSSPMMNKRSRGKPQTPEGVLPQFILEAILDPAVQLLVQPSSYFWFHRIGAPKETFHLGLDSVHPKTKTNTPAWLVRGTQPSTFFHPCLG